MSLGGIEVYISHCGPPPVKASILQEEPCLGPTNFHEKGTEGECIPLACTPALRSQTHAGVSWCLEVFCKRWSQQDALPKSPLASQGSYRQPKWTPGCFSEATVGSIKTVVENNSKL